MALDGKYNIRLKTPLGHMKAVVVMEEKDGKCSGSITCLASVAPFENGDVDGNKFKFSAVMPTPVGKIKFDMEGSVDGDEFNAVTDSSLGHIVITGERVAE